MARDEIELIKKLMEGHQFTKALELAQNILTTSIEKDEKRELYFLVAKIFYFLGENKKALKFIEKALNLTDQDIVELKEFIELQIEYGKILRRNKRSEEAHHIYTKLLDNYKEKLDEKTYAIIYHNLANIFLEQGKFDKAKELFFKVLEIDEKYQNQKGLAQTYSSIAALSYFQGDGEEAERYYSKSLAIRRTIGDKTGIATTCLNLGTIHANKFDVEKAEQYLNEAIETFTLLQHQRGIKTVKETLGAMYFGLGEYEKAISNLEHISTIPENQLKPRQIEKIVMICESLLKLERIEEAEKLILKSLRAVEYFLEEQKNSIVTDIGKLKQIYSQLLVKKGQYQEALTVLEDLKEMSFSLEDEQSLIAIYVGKASVYGIIGQNDKAIENLIQAEKLAIRFHDTSLILIRQYLIRAYILTGNYRKSVEYLEKQRKTENKLHRLKIESIIRTLKLAEKRRIRSISKYRSNEIPQDIKSLFFFQEVLRLIQCSKFNLKRINRIC